MALVNQGLSDVFGTAIIENPLVPAIETKIIPPTRLEEQAGNILFRLFCHPPRCKKETYQIAYFFNPKALLKDFWGESLLSPSTPFFAMHPKTAKEVRKALAVKSTDEALEELDKIFYKKG